MCATKPEAIRQSYRKACSGGTTSTDLWTQTRFKKLSWLLSRQLDARIRFKKVNTYRLCYIIVLRALKGSEDWSVYMKGRKVNM